MNPQVAHQLIASVKVLNTINTATPILPYQEYIVYIPITLGVCSFVLFSYALIQDSYRDSHPHNMYDELIRDALERGILEPTNNGDIELQNINRNNTTTVNEGASVPDQRTSSQFNTTQQSPNLSRSSQDINIRNNTLEAEDTNHITIEKGISEVIKGSTSMKNEVLKNTNNSLIVEEINKKRLSSDKFKKPNSSDDTDLGID